MFWNVTRRRSRQATWDARIITLRRGIRAEVCERQVTNRGGSISERDRARSTSANFDFGQYFDFGQFLDVEFLDHKGWCPKGWRPQPRNSGVPKPGAPGFGAPKGRTKDGGGRRGGESPKFRAFFVPLQAQFSFFSPSLVGLFVEFWWCLKRRGRQMCTFGVLWLTCESPAASRILNLYNPSKISSGGIFVIDNKIPSHFESNS